MATNAPQTHLTEPAEDVNFKRFVAALRGHALTFWKANEASENHAALLFTASDGSPSYQ